MFLPQKYLLCLPAPLLAAAAVNCGDAAAPGAAPVKFGQGWVVAVSLGAAGAGRPQPLAACHRAAPAAEALPFMASPVGHSKPRYADAAAVKLLIFAEGVVLFKTHEIIPCFGGGGSDPCI